MPTILHLDADAFFASLEQRDDRTLRGKPVAVGTGVVASSSYEAKRLGVRTGMSLAEARSLCRPLIVVPGDYRRYEQAARCMLAICQEQTPLVEVAALDDLYLDLTQNDRPEQVAGTLREQVRDEVGLNTSMGLGTNKMIAQVATDDAKQWKLQHQPDAPARGRTKPLAGASGWCPQSGTVCVPAGGERDYLAPWPARVLPGVGPKVQSRLERLNVQRVGELAAMPAPLLCGLFGNQGRVLHAQARGLDPRPVDPYKPPRSVSRRTSFEPVTGDRAFLSAMLDYLLERACSWLRFRGLATRGLIVTIRYGDYEGAEGRLPFRRATADEQELKAAARDRFARLYQRRLPLRLLGVDLQPLTPPDAQPGLFADPDGDRARRLADCKDAIRRRFGFMSLLTGSALQLAGRLERDRENFRLRTPCLTR
jgi:DNA polymerase-4